MDAGLADEVIAAVAPANVFDLSMFRNTPRSVMEPSAGRTTQPEVESVDPDWQQAARFAIAAAQMEVA